MRLASIREEVNEGSVSWTTSGCFNLEAMDERQARRFLVELFSVLSAEKEYTVRHED